MRLTFALGEQEHWVEVRDDIIWTRKRLREIVDARVDQAVDVVRQMDSYVTGCHISDVDGREYDDWAAITDDLLDNLHPAVLEFIAWLPMHAKNAQAALGNVRGGRL